MNRTTAIAALILLTTTTAWFYLKKPMRTAKTSAARTLEDYQPGSFFKDCDTCPEMAVIPESSHFMMGQTQATVNNNLVSQLMNQPDTTRQPLHAVSIRRFALGRMEVTHAQWESLMGKNEHSPKECGADCPVENVSWRDIQEYIKKLNAKTNQAYRLPSEAEWEYSAAAGGDEKTDLSDERQAANHAWHEGNSDLQIHAVGRKAANAFKLHDMQGNVWEWVEDCFHSNYVGAPADGSAWVGDTNTREFVRKAAVLSAAGRPFLH